MVDGDVEIEITIVVEVNGGQRVQIHVGESQVRLLLELCVAPIAENDDAFKCCQDQVLVAIIVQIDEQGACRLIKVVDACFRRMIQCGAVRLLDEKLVRKACALAEIDVIEIISIGRLRSRFPVV